MTMPTTSAHDARDVATWTTTQAARQLGVSAGRFRSLAAAARVVPCGREPGRYGENLYRPGAVLAIPRPGQGTRSDLHGLT